MSMAELSKAVKQCKRGVSWKDGPTEMYVGRIAFCKRLRDDILNGTYKLRKGTKVYIYHPKKRVATAPWFRDRVWQRAMCNNGVYHDLTKSFIYDNIACQKGKGTDLAIRRVIKFLQRLYRTNPEATIYGIHLDVKRYFPSTPQQFIKELDKERITERRYLPYLEEQIDSYDDERPEEEIANDKLGKRGTGLGSQINQLHQVALLDRLDHELKCFCKFYIRYNDDFLILDHEKEVITQARDIIQGYLEQRGLVMTDKSGVFNAKHGFSFLRKRFFISETGKIVILLHKKAMKEERDKLRGLKRLVSQGYRNMQDVERHYQSWIANAEYAGDAPIRAMDKFYTELFRQKPKYKRKKRYLYGNPCKPKRENNDAGKGKQKATRRTGKGQKPA